MTQSQGKVYIIGGGPGDPELLTLKAKSVIESADVIIYADSLVHPSIVDFAKPGAEVSAAGIAKALEQRLAKFKQPKQVLVVTDLPRNTMGKVQKNLLREQYKDIYAKQLKAGE